MTSTNVHFFFCLGLLKGEGPAFLRKFECTIEISSIQDIELRVGSRASECSRIGPHGEDIVLSVDLLGPKKCYLDWLEIITWRILMSVLNFGCFYTLAEINLIV